MERSVVDVAVTRGFAAGHEPRRTNGYLPIEDYAAIGDGRTVALVGRDCSIDWMCLPEMDSPSVFAALLDPDAGGSFSLAPTVPYAVTRRYVPQTNVLSSEITTAGGVVRITDAVTADAAWNGPWRELVREVECLAGTVPMQWRLRPRFDYGQTAPDPGRCAGALIWRHGTLQVALRCWDVGEPSVSDGAVTGAFTLEQGRRTLFTMIASDETALPIPARQAVERRLGETAERWRAWLRRSSYDGPWRDAVERSLLAIGLLADARSGAIAAAATTSLPEVVGAARNYDYRFGWVRDLSFTADALMRVGMEEPAHGSVMWLLAAISGTHPRVDPVYSLNGDAVRTQHTIELAGYAGSSPVHVGNQAGAQLQLGGYGDLLETIWRYVGAGHVLSPEAGERLAESADLLCRSWQSRDAGLWELGESAHYATSKISCWTALERLLDLVGQGQVPARGADRWRLERERMRGFIESRIWSDARGSYLMKADSDMLDCGVLLAARRGFADPGGTRMRSTINAIRAELHAEGPLLYRYSGMREEENAFLACSFWMVEALALAGRRDEAAEVMDAMVDMGNDLGLFSEEIEPGSHALRGNFPQALTHLALISAASILGGSG